jgi:hypothetical protein
VSWGIISKERDTISKTLATFASKHLRNVKSVAPHDGVFPLNTGDEPCEFGENGEPASKMTAAESGDKCVVKLLDAMRADMAEIKALCLQHSLAAMRPRSELVDCQ